MRCIGIGYMKVAGFLQGRIKGSMNPFIEGLILLLAVLLLCSCTTAGESFSCNETAGDSCLTMDEVNAMTEEQDGFARNNTLKSGRYFYEPGEGGDRDKDSASSNSLWLAEQDKKDHAHA